MGIPSLPRLSDSIRPWSRPPKARGRRGCGDKAGVQAALGLWAPDVLLLWRLRADNARKQLEEASRMGPQSLQGGVGPAQGNFLTRPGKAACSLQAPWVPINKPS